MWKQPDNCDTSINRFFFVFKNKILTFHWDLRVCSKRLLKDHWPVWKRNTNGMKTWKKGWNHLEFFSKEVDGRKIRNKDIFTELGKREFSLLLSLHYLSFSYLLCCLIFCYVSYPSSSFSQLSPVSTLANVRSDVHSET